ncbi:MAG TPA: RIP metalloprotease RseP [Burkholderiales bacterium]|nr:RIP metalloprotease RseP [Burkholderiales bacterium]
MELLSTVFAFVVALGVLITFHEYGHYAVARLVGVKVLRFSVGFGTPLFSRKLGRDGTEWVVAAFPLGGYVKMLDEREAPVAPEERHRAFNRQPVWSRVAIVVAGPIANFLLAVLLYWILFLHGVPGLRPVIGDPLPSTPAAVSQLASGDLVVSVGGTPIPTWQELRWELLDHAIRRSVVTLEVQNERGEIRFPKLDLSTIRSDEIDADLLSAIGITRYDPPLSPVIGRLVDGSPAQKAGLQQGDTIVAIDGQPVGRWDELVNTVRAAPGRTLLFEVLRGGRTLELSVAAESATDEGKAVGRIGAGPQVDQEQIEKLFTEVRYGPLASVGKAMQRMGEVSMFTLRMLGRMIVGDVSLKNLSGPLTIADYAGQSAQLGWLPYLSFLALISISLGVLNLLPIPILDGGHLMYYVVEIVKGSPVSERVMEIGQQIGIVLLFSLMAFALYNDINRLVGG